MPLLLVAGHLEPAPSWWILDLTRRRTPADTIDTYSKSIELWFNALRRNRLEWWSVTANTADKYINSLLRRGNSKNTIATRLAAILTFYKWAVAKRLLPNMPFEKQHLNIPKGGEEPVRAHSQKEFEQIVAHLPYNEPGPRRRFELICEAGRFLGLRRKEIVGLTAEQFMALDLNAPIALLWTDPRYTKRGKKRAVLVPRLFAGKVRKFIETYRSETINRIRKTKPQWEPLPNLFISERGTAVGEDYITDTWKRAAKSAGLESRFHNNRSSLATHVADVALEIGLYPEALVRDILGHANESTAQRYITHAKLRKRLLIEANIINTLYDAEAGNND